VFDDDESICSWNRESALGITTVSLNFRDVQTIKGVGKSALASTGTPWPATLPQFFDHVVKFTASNALGKPEPVKGIGERATFVSDAISSLVIQRRDGVAHLTSFNLARDRMLAVGRIVAAR
jgi:hypothetical protein